MMATPPRSNFVSGSDPAATARSLNEFARDTTFCLDKRLTFGENMDAEIKDIVVEGGKLPLTFQSRYNRPPAGVIMLYYQEDDSNPEIMCNTLGFQWRYSPQVTGGIEIRNIPGLTEGQRYKVRLLVIGG